jgi:hypothetical protein
VHSARVPRGREGRVCALRRHRCLCTSAARLLAPTTGSKGCGNEFLSFCIEEPCWLPGLPFRTIAVLGSSNKATGSLHTREQVFSTVKLLEQFTCVFTWRAGGGCDKPNEEWVLGTATRTKELGCGTGYGQQRDRGGLSGVLCFWLGGTRRKIKTRGFLAVSLPDAEPALTRPARGGTEASLIRKGNKIEEGEKSQYSDYGTG